MSTPFANPTTDTAKAPRAEYAAPTLSRLLVQRTENGAGLANDGFTIAVSQD
jgi:hypothetical protein